MELIEKRLRLPRQNLALLQFILEGYDRIFAVTTLDAHAAVVQIFMPQSRCREGETIINALKDEMDMEWVPI